MLGALAWAAVALVAIAGHSNADGPAASLPPATFEQFAAAINFEKLPRLADAAGASAAPSHVMYTSGSKLDEAMAFYRKHLDILGWKENKIEVPGLDAAKYALTGFEKNGFYLTVSISVGQEPGKISVYIANNGNVDPSAFPRPADAKIKTALRSNFSYTSALKPEAIESLLREKMPALGWKEEGDDSAAFHRKEGRFILNFIANAMKLLVVIFTNKEGQTEAGYYPQLRENAELLANSSTAKTAVPAKYGDAIEAIDLRAFPRLPAAAKVRKNSAGVFYAFDGKVADAVSFYQRELSAAGWQESRTRELDLDDRVSMHFAKSGFRLHLFVSKDSRSGKTEVSLLNEGNVDVSQLPRLDDARITIADFANLHYSTAKDMAAATAYCREQLGKLGWKERAGPNGSKQLDHAAVLKFVQNAVQLTIEIQPFQGRTGVHINPRLIGAP